jgi:uncharacterized membrane protein YhdT
MTLSIDGRGRALSPIGLVVVATLIAGTLDILSAFVFAGVKGVGPVAVLNYVASGPFGDGALRGAGWALVGLAVHYAIMAWMVAAYMAVAPRVPALLRHPVAAGLAYGLLLWVFMYWVVKPLRWPEAPLPHTLYGIANALFSHCVLVGLPIALIAARWGARQPR